MVCASVREDNPQALASELFYVQSHKPCNKQLYCIVALVNLITPTLLTFFG